MSTKQQDECYDRAAILFGVMSNDQEISRLTALLWLQGNITDQQAKKLAADNGLESIFSYWK